MARRAARASTARSSNSGVSKTTTAAPPGAAARQGASAGRRRNRAGRRALDIAAGGDLRLVCHPVECAEPRTGRGFGGSPRGLRSLPSGSFQANPAWLVMAAITFNLTRACCCLASAFHARATTGTIRAQLINVPARLANSARKLRLHLPASWPWEPAWTQLFDATLGPPTAA